MKRFKDILKSKSFVKGLFVVLFIANLGLAFDISAADGGLTKSASESNLFTILNADENPQCAIAVNKGVIGGAINVVTDFTSGIRYSEYIAAQENICPDQITTASLQRKVQQNPGVLSIANGLNNTILAQRPSSGINYIQEKVYALTNPTSVNAQSREEYYSPGGTGFDLLRPIQSFWSWSVRVVYGVLILLIIAMAFGIMFKSKLPVVGEITIQNAIPAITLAMILVPLSYAISGVFIDVITVGTNAVHQFLIGTPASPGYQIYLNSATDTGTGSGAVDRGYFADDPRVSFMYIRDRINVKEPASAVFNSTIQNDNSGIVNNGIVTTINSIINSIFHSDGGVADASRDMTWLGDICQFVISLASIWISIKIFVRLFKKYLTMIIAPIISPFIFATVAIPGNGIKSVMDYAKLLWSCSLSYIVTYLMFLLTIIFTDPSFQAGVPNIASGFFRPPLLNIGAFGIDSGSITTALLTLIGLGIFFSIPSTLEGIDVALGTNSMLPKFITTPIDSFQDGLSFAGKSITGSARSIQAGAKGISDVRIGARSAMQNARTRALNFADRARNISASDSDSWQSRRSRDYNKRITDLTQQMETADRLGNRGLRNKLAADIERVKAEAKALGVSTYGVSEEEKKKDGKSIAVSIEWNGNPAIADFVPGPNRITFNNSQINRLHNLLVVNRDTVLNETLFKLKIDFQNIPLPDKFTTSQLTLITEGPVDSNGVQTYVQNKEGSSLADIDPVGGKVTAGDNLSSINFLPFPFLGKPAATDPIYRLMRFTYNANDIAKVPTMLQIVKPNTFIKIPLVLQMDPMTQGEFESLFGVKNPTTNIYDGIGAVQKGLISEKRGFSYGATDSNVVTLIVGVASDQK